MFSPSLRHALAACLAATLCSVVHAQVNLIQDPSFESRLRPWFAEHTASGAQPYYIGFLKTPDAADGEYVLDVEGWTSNGWSRILSPSVVFAENQYSATLHARCIGENPATVELAVYSANEPFNGKRKLFAFASKTLNPHRALAQMVPPDRPGLRQPVADLFDHG